MRNNFVAVFLEMLQELPGAVLDSFRHESLHYKDLRAGGLDPLKVYRGFRNLEQRGIIRRTQKGGYNFTAPGRRWYRKSLLRHHRLQRTRWDGKWRVLLFDIPNELSNERNKFRTFLKRVGFHMLQKSVFVFPYDCEEEVARISRQYKIDSYVNVITADSLGWAEGEVKKLFRL